MNKKEDWLGIFVVAMSCSRVRVPARDLGLVRFVPSCSAKGGINQTFLAHADVRQKGIGRIVKLESHQWSNILKNGVSLL